VNPWLNKKKGWNANPLQRNSLRKAEVRKGFLMLTLAAVLLVGGGAGSMMLFYRWLCVSDFFQVTAIDITGNQEVDKNTILQLAGVDAHANLLALDLEVIAPKIRGYGWIEEVKLWKEWPSHLHIEVRERRPLALINTKSGLYYVDSKGQPFAVLNGQTEIDFPVITGLEDSVTVKGKSVVIDSLEPVRAALQFIGYAAKGTSSLPAQNISEIHYDENQEVILFLADRPFPIFLSKELGKKAYNRLAKVLYWLYKKKEFQTVAYIRLDYLEDKILVGTTGSPKTASALRRDSRGGRCFWSKGQDEPEV